MGKIEDWTGKKFYNERYGWCQILRNNYPKLLMEVEKGTQHYIVAKMYKAPDVYYVHQYYDLDKAEEFYNRYITEDNHD